MTYYDKIFSLYIRFAKEYKVPLYNLRLMFNASKESIGEDNWFMTTYADWGILIVRILNYPSDIDYSALWRKVSQIILFKKMGFERWAEKKCIEWGYTFARPSRSDYETSLIHTLSGNMYRTNYYTTNFDALLRGYFMEYFNKEFNNHEEDR